MFHDICHGRVIKLMRLLQVVVCSDGFDAGSEGHTFPAAMTLFLYKFGTSSCAQQGGTSVQRPVLKQDSAII